MGRKFSKLPLLFCLLVASWLLGTRQPLWGEGTAPASGREAPSRPEPWLQGAFATPAPDLLSAAAQVPALGEEPAQMIFQDTHFDLDAEGRITFRRYWVYRVLRAEGLRDWGISQVRWSPWHQERPKVRARIVAASGEEQSFDDSGYTERPAPEGREDLVGQRRILEKKLPAQVGSVVEEEVLVRDRAPYFSAGTVLRHYATLYIPVHHGRLTLQAPTRLALRYGVRKLPGVEPRKVVEGGQVQLTFEYRDMPPAAAVEVGIPGHRPRFPHIAFSSGRDWAAVAAAYQRRVETAIADPQLAGALAALPPPPPGLGRRALAENLLRALSQRVVGSGLELGATDPSPTQLAAVLARGQGDGKEIASLFVALARRHGLPAQVALVNSGFGPDIELKLPGLGLFNHALVLIPARAGDAEIWLDPSAPYARVGELPLPAQGRYALVLDGRGELVATPISRPQDNRIAEEREVFFADYGLGRIEERSEHFGSADRNARQIGEGMDMATRRRGYQAYVQAMYQASSLGEVRETPATDLSTQFTLKLEALGSGLVRTDFDQARLAIPVRDLVRRLPNVLLTPGMPRQEEFIFHEPFVTQWRYRIHPPDGFVATELPEPVDLPLGAGSFRARFRAEDDGTVVGDLELDVGQRLLSAAQFEALRASAIALAARPDLVVLFAHRTRLTVAAGRAPEALAELRAAVAAEPGRPSHQARLARLLLDFGLVAAARRYAEDAVALSPAWAAAHFVHGQTLSFDEVGREFSPWAELEAAAAEFARAAEIEPDEPRFASAAAKIDQAMATRRLRQPAGSGGTRPDLLEDDPQLPLRRLLLAHIAGDPAGVRAALHPRTLDLAGTAPAETLLAALAPAAVVNADGSRLGPDEALDQWVARLSPQVSGTPHLGYRIALDGIGETAYVAKVDGALRLVCTRSDWALVGWEALARLDAGDIDGAYRWLDWVAADLAALPGNDPLGPRQLAGLWPWRGKDNAAGRASKKNAARRAAAFLAAFVDRTGRVAPWLENPGEEASPELLLALEVAKAAQNHAAGRVDPAAAAGDLRRRHPGSALAWRWHLAALATAGDWPALAQAATERWQQSPGDPEAQRMRVLAALRQEDFAGAEAQLDSLRQAGQLTAASALQRVGLKLAKGGAPEPAVLKELWADLAPWPATAEILAWRAAVLVELGDIPGARQHLLAAVEARPLGAPRLEDSYLFGRIAEFFGLEDLARDAYARLPTPQEPLTFAWLARHRLRNL